MPKKTTRSTHTVQVRNDLTPVVCDSPSAMSAFRQWQRRIPVRRLWGRERIGSSLVVTELATRPSKTVSLQAGRCTGGRLLRASAREHPDRFWACAAAAPSNTRCIRSARRLWWARALHGAMWFTTNSASDSIFHAGDAIAGKRSSCAGARDLWNAGRPFSTGGVYANNHP